VERYIFSQLIWYLFEELCRLLEVPCRLTIKLTFTSTDLPVMSREIDYRADFLREESPSNESWHTYKCVHFDSFKLDSIDID